MKQNNIKDKFKIPSEIENAIFNDLNGIFRRVPSSAHQNLNSDYEQQKINLGTYFPRSFSEAYTLFKDMFFIYNKNLENKKEIYILDIGSGTGGNLLGLLWFIKDAFKDFSKMKITVVSIDGNDQALDIQASLFEKFFPDNIDLVLVNNLISRENLKSDLVDILDGFKFDIIMTFKFVNELYRDSAMYYSNKGMYTKLLETLDCLLDAHGIFILADVTDKTKFDIYIPKLMNQETADYLSNNISKLVPILPLSCAFWHNHCENGNCYTQKENFFILKGKNYSSKLSYKVFVNQKLQSNILKQIEKHECYRISKDNICLRGKHNRTENLESIINCKDAYLFN